MSLWKFSNLVPKNKKRGKRHLVRKAAVLQIGGKTQSTNQGNDWSELERLLAAAAACVINPSALGQCLQLRLPKIHRSECGGDIYIPALRRVKSCCRLLIVDNAVKNYISLIISPNKFEIQSSVENR